RTVANSDVIMDPSYISYQSDGTLFVADFEGFGGTGSIYQLNVDTGEKDILAAGKPLRDPVFACWANTDRRVLYVSNAVMHYSYTIRPDGSVGKDSSTILKYSYEAKAGSLLKPNMSVERVYDEGPSSLGAIIGMCPIDAAGSELLLVRGDWPAHSTGA